MYRCNATKSLSYTPEDLLLFEESPFASWMERLNVDNPDHGIEPDWHHKFGDGYTDSSSESDNKISNVESVSWNDFVDSRKPPPPLDGMRRYDSATSRQSDTGDVVVFEQCSSESLDGNGTLAAMHAGAPFVINARLVQAPLSCNVDILLRSSGVSDLGDYLYLPCATTKDTSENAAQGLSFAADLLEGIQGKLPPQMLVIPPGSQMATLNTQDHILHFRAMKKRFLESQGAFKKHRVPNPEDSSNFGRWSQCADAILKRRALGKDTPDGSKTKTVVAYSRGLRTQKKMQVFVDSDLPEKIVKTNAVG